MKTILNPLSLLNSINTTAKLMEFLWTIPLGINLCKYNTLNTSMDLFTIVDLPTLTPIHFTQSDKLSCSSKAIITSIKIKIISQGSVKGIPIKDTTITTHSHHLNNTEIATHMGPIKCSSNSNIKETIKEIIKEDILQTPTNIHPNSKINILPLLLIQMLLTSTQWIFYARADMICIFTDI